jgi:hypothetical protein
MRVELPEGEQRLALVPVVTRRGYRGVMAPPAHVRARPLLGFAPPPRRGLLAADPSARPPSLRAGLWACAGLLGLVIYLFELSSR